MKRIKNNSLYSFLFILLLNWSISHIIFVGYILMGLIFLISFYTYISNKQHYFSFKKEEKILLLTLLAFVLYAITISLFSEFRDYSIKELNQFTKLFLLSISAYFIINSFVDYKKIFLILFIIFCISILSLIVQDRKNNIASIDFLIVSVIFFINLISKKHIMLGIIGLLAAASSLIFSNFKTNKRWNRAFLKHYSYFGLFVQYIYQLIFIQEYLLIRSIKQYATTIYIFCIFRIACYV